MSTPVAERSLTEQVLETLRRAGNPFRNYFARNPDDEICTRYHVPELYAAERDLLLNVVDLYRYDPMTHSEIVPILGNKGAGKTHLLHSIKHGTDGAFQMLVTPGVYQKDTEFPEYLLFQLIDTLLGGGKQRGVRPLDHIGEQLVRRLMGFALRDLSQEERLEMFPPPGLGRWTRRLGLGHTQAQERCQWLAENLSGFGNLSRPPMPVHQAITDSGISAEKALDLISSYVMKSESHNTAGMMRRSIYQGFARGFLLKDESALAEFLTYGFAELEFHVRPSRQDLVLSLLRVMMEVFRTLKTPVVVAFDQLEDLLLSRRSDDAHKIAEAFFAGIVQVMHQIDGLCFLVFAERGLWNRFVPSLDGYIQDRLNNPIHVPDHGTVKALRLEAPSVEMVRKVVEARLNHALGNLAGEVPAVYPFTEEQIDRVGRTEPTLRDMLQQFRHLFDHLIFGQPEVESRAAVRPPVPESEAFPDEVISPAYETEPAAVASIEFPLPELVNRVSEYAEPANRIAALVEMPIQYQVKNVEVIEIPEVAARTELPVPAASEKPNIFTDLASPIPATQSRTSALSAETMLELREQEHRAARRKLEPDGALTGATREIQAGLGAFLRACHENGVKVGPWRLQHVVPEFSFSEHPTYGVMTIAHWACKDGQPWKVGIGLFLAKGAGKPRDLEVKLTSMETEPAVIDHLILLRPEDDLSLTGRSKTMWNDAEKRGRHARIEAMSLDSFAMIYSFPRWLAVLTEALPEGQPLPNLADLIQDQCEKLLEQVCLPVTG